LTSIAGLILPSQGEKGMIEDYARKKSLAWIDSTREKKK